MQVQYRGKALWACTNSLVKIHTEAPASECKFLNHGKAVQDGLALPRSMDEPPWEVAALLSILLGVKAVVFLALYSKVARR